MKTFLIAAAGVCMLVLTGCMSITEQEAPALTEKFSTETKLHLEGFQLYTVREKQHRVGNSYSDTTDERMLDDKFPEIVKDIFESAGANIRADKPELTIEGRFGTGHYMWSSPAMWYRDAPIFVVSVCTLGIVMSKERENDVRLIICNNAGKRLKEYSAKATYYTYGFGLPLAFTEHEKIRAWYCDRMATKFALIQCVNEFVRDCNNGFYKQEK